MVDPRGSFVAVLVPGYVACMLLELALSRGKHYRLNDTISSLSCGVYSMLVANMLTSWYVWVYSLARSLFEDWGVVLPWRYDSWPAFFLLLVAQDLGYYVAHRAAHEINLVWGGHGVHHSSEEYNLSTALRQSGVERYFNVLFYLPLAMIADIETFAFMADLNATYQFWVHTKAIRRMPAWFEFIFVTPSHHRVHHARNPRMIDKNYSGMFIVWDRLFGTFQAEDEECFYGLIKPIQTFNPFVVQLGHFVHIARVAATLPGVVPKLRYLFGSPSIDVVTGKRMEFPAVSSKQPKYDPVIAPSVKLWAGIVFFGFLMVPVVTWIVLSKHFLSAGQRLVSAALFAAEMTLISLATDGRMHPTHVYYCVVGWTVAAAFFVSRVASVGVAAGVFGPLLVLSHVCLVTRGSGAAKECKE